MKIKNKNLGKDHPCFIIAEAGVNHNGKLENAYKLVDIAKEAGADAVKFQLYRIEEQISKIATNAPYQRKGSGKKSMTEMAKEYDLAWEEHINIKNYCDQKKIIYMSSCFDKLAVDFFVNDLRGDCIKVGSGEITNYPLLEHMSKTGKLIILSTGMCNLEEVKIAINKIGLAGESKIILLHCISSYPALEKDINLKSMQTLANVFQLPVGYSDHSINNTAAIAAIAMGACIIEKHFTIDQKLPGPDHQMSLNPDELKNLINSIRSTELLLGDGIKKPTESEEEMKIYSRRGIVSLKKIKSGEIINSNNVGLKRPATGIDAGKINEIYGKKAKIEIENDIPISWKMLEK